MNQGWVYRDFVASSEAGLTLLSYYTKRYRHSSEADWRSRIETGQILVDGQAAIATHCLQAGQSLTYHRPPWEEPSVPLKFEILHQDDDLLVVAKPSGLPVMPGGGFLEHTLLWQLKQRFPHSSSPKPGLPNPGFSNGEAQVPVPIHRLGRGTSGLVLLGRSPLAKSELTRQMRDRQMTKIYRARVKGTDLPEQFVLNTPIGKIPHPTLGYIFAATPEGRFAHSEGRVLQCNGEDQTTLVEVKILTGRPHQIRIHMAAMGHPLVGDPLYLPGGQPSLEPNTEGRLPVPGDCGYWLHAFRLGFEHPRSHQSMKVECPPPTCLKDS